MPAPPLSFRDALTKILSPAEQREAIYGFDILGDMALVEIPATLQKKSKKIARTLLDTHSNLSRVYEKVGQHSGKFRVEKIRWLAGKKDPIAIAKEWGVLLRVHPGEVYYSPRLGTERQRVISQIAPGQSVVVFFAGAGPYAILAAKHARPSHVVAIEWNPKAIPFLNENIRLNKMEKIIQVKKGDAGKIFPIPAFDHVLMPAPDTAADYLPAALKWLSKKGGLVHVYTFVSSARMEQDAREKIKKAMKGVKRKWRILSIHKVNDFSPTKRQVCVALKVARSAPHH